MALLGAAWVPMWFFLNLYLQQVLGFGPFAAGAALLPDDGRDDDPHGRRDRARSSAASASGATLIAGLRRASPAGSRSCRSCPPTAASSATSCSGSLVAAVGMSLAYIPAMLRRDGRRYARRGGARLRHRQHDVPGRLGARPRCHDGGRDVPGADQLGNPLALIDGYSAAFVGAAAIAIAGAAVAALFIHRPTAATDPAADDTHPVAA